MRWLLVVFIGMALISCNGHVVFQEREDLPEKVWNYSNPLKFIVEIDDINEPYDIYLDIEHSRDFTYGNLYTGLTIIPAAGDSTFQRISTAWSATTPGWMSPW